MAYGGVPDVSADLAAAGEFTTMEERTVADVALVLLTVGLFVVLALVVRAVERL